MVLSHRQADIRLGQGQVIDPGIVLHYRGGHQNNILFLVEEGRHHLVQIHAAVQRGKSLPFPVFLVLLYQVDQHPLLQNPPVSNAQMGHLQHLGHFGTLNGIVAQMQNLLGVPVEYLPAAGQLDLVLVAGQQLAVQFILQVGNLFADSCLGHIAAFGRFGKTFVIGCGNKIPKLLKGHPLLSTSHIAVKMQVPPSFSAPKRRDFPPNGIDLSSNAGILRKVP